MHFLFKRTSKGEFHCYVNSPECKPPNFHLSVISPLLNRQVLKTSQLVRRILSISLTILLWPFSKKDQTNLRMVYRFVIPLIRSSQNHFDRNPIFWSNGILSSTWLELAFSHTTCHYWSAHENWRLPTKLEGWSPHDEMVTRFSNVHFLLSTGVLSITDIHRNPRVPLPNSTPPKGNKA